MKKIIYDFGSARGENIPYYLLKSDLVVAVEANPDNCIYIKNKFKKEIENSQLCLINCILAEKSDVIKKFYIHKNNYLLGQFPKPDNLLENNFYSINLLCKDVLEIIRTYGEPHYIKIDLEQYDKAILKRILLNGIKPPYISVEGTSENILEILFSKNGYSAFKLIEGSNVGYLYRNQKINLVSDIIKYSFPKNSAGPFGNDIYGHWIDKEKFLQLMGFKNFGWRDIHCSLEDHADTNISFEKLMKIEIKREKKAKIIKRFLRIISKFF